MSFILGFGFNVVIPTHYIYKFQLRFLLYSLYTRPQALHVHYEFAAAWLGISISYYLKCDFNQFYII